MSVGWFFGLICHNFLLGRELFHPPYHLLLMNLRKPLVVRRTVWRCTPCSLLGYLCYFFKIYVWDLVEGGCVAKLDHGSLGTVHSFSPHPNKVNEFIERIYYH